MLKTAFKVLLILLALWLGNSILLAFLSPSGVWIRREIRENPLNAPIKVTSIDGLRLTTPDGVFAIGGVSLPASSQQQLLLERFLRTATAQGIEIVDPGDFTDGHTLRCEPRIWHWCGCDPVEAHFEQHNLTELLVFLGFAEISDEARTSNTQAANRLRGAEFFRMKFAAHTKPEECFSDQHGIDITAAMNIEGGIVNGCVFLDRGTRSAIETKP